MNYREAQIAVLDGRKVYRNPYCLGSDYKVYLSFTNGSFRETFEEGSYGDPKGFDVNWFEDQIEQSIVFEVGDECEAFGLSCWVNRVNDGFIIVTYKEPSLVGVVEVFYADGKRSSYHKTASLTLIKKALKKVTKYRYAFFSVTDYLILTNDYYLNDEDFTRKMPATYSFQRLDFTAKEFLV